MGWVHWSLAVFGVATTLAMVSVVLMHSHIISLQSELEAVRRQSVEARGPRCPTEATRDITSGLANTVATVGAAASCLNEDAPRFPGYTNVTSVAMAVQRGVDVRLVQDDAPVRNVAPDQAEKTTIPSRFDMPYERCVELIARGEGRRPRRFELPQHKVHWLHIPKCGSSFGAVLYGLVCQAEPSPATSPYTGEPCDYCGMSAKGSQRWDAVLYDVIDWAALP